MSHFFKSTNEVTQNENKEMKYDAEEANVLSNGGAVLFFWSNFSYRYN